MHELNVTERSDESCAKKSDVSPENFVIEKTSASSEVGEDNVTMNSRVARLSICEDGGMARDMIATMLHNTDRETAIEAHDGPVKLPSKKNRKKKRRRSSAVSAPGSNSLTNESSGAIGESSSQSSLEVTKKKRSSNKPISIHIAEKALEKGISVRDLCELTLHSMSSTTNQMRWARVENASAIKKVIVLFVPGLEPEDFNLPDRSTFRENAQKLQKSLLKGLEDSEMIKELQCFPVRSPGSRTSIYSAYSSFINVGLTKKEKKERQEELEKKKITIADLLLNLNELLENDYPIHPDTPGLSDQIRNDLLAKYQIEKREFRDTIKFEHEGSHIFALDCEMCLSKDGYVLTRVSIIDFELNVVYDKLVKPDVPIIDYLTQYSGITEDKLRDVTTSFQDVQNDILKMISADDILIGHSLKSDLNVLKIRHPNVVDTAVIFHHKAGPPFKPALRYLASTYLNYDIQTSDEIGHDSIEDAKACMELTKLKIVNGLAFGVGINTENIFHRLQKKNIKSIQLNDYAPKNQCSWINNTDSSIRCTSDSELLNSIIDNIEKYDLFVGRLRGLEFSRGYAKPSILNTEEIPSPTKALQTFTQLLQRIYDKAPLGTLILTYSGCGNTKRWNEIMTEINKVSKDERKEEMLKWNTELEDAVLKARDAVAFIALKQQVNHVSKKVVTI